MEIKTLSTYLIRLLDRCYLFAKYYEIMKVLFTSIVTSVPR